MTIGERLRAARNDCALSQTDFAALGGVAKRAQINFERDENLPNSAYWLGLHAAGVDVHYILTGLPGALNAEEAALLMGFRAADEAGKKKMMGNVK